MRKEVAWPSGLRRWFKAPVSSEEWVRIPPLPSNVLTAITDIDYLSCIKNWIVAAFCQTQNLVWENPHFTKHILFIALSLWRNRLARSAVNRKVGGSSPPRDGKHFYLRIWRQKRIFFFGMKNLEKLLSWENLKSLGILCIGGSVVEFSPATRAARVRFPADANFGFFNVDK